MAGGEHVGEGEQSVAAVEQELLAGEHAALELVALTEVLGVLERERVKPEEVAQRDDVVVAGGRDVQPEEVIALEVIANACFVDARE